MRLLSLTLVVFILVSSLYGCATMQEQPTSAQGLAASSMLRFNDVPYPAGFKILTEKSFILESGNVRAGVLKYTGKGNVEDIVRFYKTKMPTYNWALLNILEYGERMLNFERENEGCLITIKSKGRRVDISVSLAPKSPILTPKKSTAVGELPKVNKGK